MMRSPPMKASGRQETTLRPSIASTPECPRPDLPEEKVDGTGSDDDFRDLFEEAPIAYVHEGLDSRFLRANRAARALLNLRPEQVPGMYGKSLITGSKDSRDRLMEAFDALQRGEETIGLVVELQPVVNGPTVWVEWSSRPAANGLYTRTMLVDITQRVLTEQAKEALEFSLESGQVGEWDLDLQTETSRRSLRHDLCFGYAEPIPTGDWGTAAFIRHVHPDDRQRVESSFRGAIESRADWSEEFRVVWPDESVHTLIAKGRVYRVDRSGRALRVLGIVMDISDRKRIEEALVASERLALSQVEALTRTLDALAAEAAPDRLAEHLLRTLIGQLGAQSCSVWLREAESGLFDLQSTLEGEVYNTRAHLATQGVSLRIPFHGFWRHDIVTGDVSVMEDIRTLQDSAWRARLMALGVVTVMMVPMFLGGTFDGAIGIRFNRRREFRKAELDLAKALASQTNLALQLSRLSAQAREAAVTAERNRMVRDIHDTLAQGFTGVIVQLEASADARVRGLSREADAHIERAKDLARESLGEARRSVRALRPQGLESGDLNEAIEVLIRRTLAGTLVEAEFVVSGQPRRLPNDCEENLMRIVQEVLTNMLRHARATRFEASVDFTAADVRLVLADNGQGFDRTSKSEGFGLLGIEERVAEMGGLLTIDSKPAAGVRVSIVLPHGSRPGPVT